MMSNWGSPRVCRDEIYALASLTPFPTSVTYRMGVIACDLSFSTGLKKTERKKGANVREAHIHKT